MTNRGKIALTVLCTAIFVLGAQTWWKKLVPKLEVRVAKPEFLENPGATNLIVHWMGGEVQTNPPLPTNAWSPTNKQIELGFAYNGQVYWRLR